MNIKWSEKEKDYIRENAATMKDVDIADELTLIAGRVITLDAVRKVRQKMGIMKKPGRGVCGVVYDRSEAPHASNKNAEGADFSN
tara:strand:+ start:4702 stop:4956 length:255 start_codon:yes stop_codon:yes gene_type:complete